jgi:ABC-type lipoprotein export system ATPase subunit
MSDTVLYAKDIQKSYYDPKRVNVLKDISIEIKKGQTLAIKGASGEGKTTLLHILGTIEKPSSGILKINNQAIDNRANINKIRNRDIGFIFQAYNLLEDLTVIENLLMPIRIARKNISKTGSFYQKAIDLLKSVKLIDRKDFPSKVLSGGEKQRLAIARALINDPKLILADEPSGNLDHDNSKIIHSLLINCVKKYNKSLLIVTHDDELSSLCDKVFLLKDGILSLISKS